MNKILVFSLILLSSTYGGPQENLWEAARTGNEAEVEAALKAGAQVNKQDERGSTALIKAASNGHTDTVRLLLEKDAEIDKQGEWGMTALTEAAYNGHTDTVRLLLEKNAEIDKQGEWGMTALAEAAYNGHTDTVRLLLEKGAEIDKQNKLGVTALMWAARNGHTDTARLLLEKGAEIDKQNKLGSTALIYATFNGHTNTVAFLIKAGASIPESLQNNPMVKEAVANKSKTTKAFFDFIKSQGTTQKAVRDRIRNLMKEGYRITTLRDDKEGNVLHIVAAYLDPESDLAKFLIHYYPALLTKQNKDGATPLQLAMMADPAKRKLFWKRVEKMPEALRKKLWDSLSPTDQKRVEKLREIIGTAKDEKPKKEKEAAED